MRAADNYYTEVIDEAGIYKTAKIWHIKCRSEDLLAGRE